MYGIFHIIIHDIIQQVWLEIKAAVDDMFRIGVNPVDVSTFVFFVNLHIHPNVSVNVVNVVNVINPVDVGALFSVNLSLLAFSCPFDPLNYNHHASPPNSYFPFDNYNHNHPSPLVSYDILILSNITIIFQVLLFFFLTKMIF